MRSTNFRRFSRRSEGRSTAEADFIALNSGWVRYITLSRNTPNCHGLEANFLVAAGLSNGFFTSNLLRAMAENTALVISVTEFDAVRPDAAAHPKKTFCSNQHAQSRGQEIDPTYQEFQILHSASKGLTRDC